MNMQPHPYVLPLAVSASISAICAVTVWRRRRILGALPLSLLLLGLMIWSGAYALLWASSSVAAQFFWICVMYIGVGIAPLSFLVFVTQITHSDWFKRHHALWLSFFPILSLLVLWTNSFHHLFFASMRPFTNQNFLEVEWVRGPWWWLNLTFMYAIALASVVVLLREIRRQGMLIRSQLITILAGALIPWAVNAVTQFWFVQFSNLDLTPIAFSFSCFFFAYAVFMQGLLDVLPIARSVLVEKMKDGIFVLDEHFRLVDINPAAQRMLELESKSVLGRNAIEILPQWADLLKDIRRAKKEIHIEVQGRINPERRYDLTITPFDVDLASGHGYLVLFRDITHHWDARSGLQELNNELTERLDEINALQSELREQAIHDALTGLYNRRFMDESLPAALKSSMQENQPLSIIMMDIDNFKEINDLYGHSAGDLILQELAGKVHKAIREGDMACRYGGDEFVIILPNVSAKVALQRAEQVRKNIEETDLVYKSIHFKVTSSMGVAMFSEHGSSMDLLLRSADKALYASKLVGKNHVTLFDPNGDMSTVRLKMPPK